MGNFKTYKDLKIWQKGMSIVKDTYRLKEKFPESERFNLQSQIRRSAVSIPSNIAEGWGRGSSTKMNVQFLKIARGSLLELETQIIISSELGYINVSNSKKLIDSIQEENKMLNAFISSIKDNTSGLRAS